MLPGDRREFAVFVELFDGVGARGVEQAQARVWRVHVGDDE